MKKYVHLFSLLGLLAGSALPAAAQGKIDVWVRHNSDANRHGWFWYGDNLYDNNTFKKPQERSITVTLNSPEVMATQSFFFNVQLDAPRSAFLWLKALNAHNFSTGARPGFAYNPALWEVTLHMQRTDGVFIPVTDYIMNWKKHFPFGDGFPLQVVGPEKGSRPNVVLRMDIRPKVKPRPNTGLTMGLLSNSGYCYSDYSAATVIFK